MVFHSKHLFLSIEKAERLNARQFLLFAVQIDFYAEIFVRKKIIRTLTYRQGSYYSLMAEKAGFEPALRLPRTTPLAGEPLQPLGYFSIAVVKKYYCSANHRSIFQSLIYDSIIKRLCQRDLSFFLLFFYIFRV